MYRSILSRPTKPAVQALRAATYSRATARPGLRESWTRSYATSSPGTSSSSQPSSLLVGAGAVLIVGGVGTLVSGNGKSKEQLTQAPRGDKLTQALSSTTSIEEPTSKPNSRSALHSADPPDPSPSNPHDPLSDPSSAASSSSSGLVAESHGATAAGHEGKEETAAAEEEQEGQEAFNPETGEINWDCPCLGGMAYGPCGEQFKAAFSCFVYSKEEPKGVDCIEGFKAMQDCFRDHPEIYATEIEADDAAAAEAEADVRAELSNTDSSTEAAASSNSPATQSDAPNDTTPQNRPDPPAHSESESGRST